MPLCKVYRGEQLNVTLSFPICSDFYPLLDCLGVYFQVRDDYCNLQSTEVGNPWSHKSVAMATFKFTISIPRTRVSVKI